MRFVLDLVRYYEQQRSTYGETVEGSFCIGGGIQEVVDACLYASIEVVGPLLGLCDVLRTLYGGTKSFLKEPLSDGPTGKWSVVRQWWSKVLRNGGIYVSIYR